MRFEWDPRKAEQNAGKHKVTFEEAIEVFTDPNAFEEFDESHFENERRYRRIGLSTRRLLLVVFVEISGDGIRLLSARKATARERKYYEQAQS